MGWVKYRCNRQHKMVLERCVHACSAVCRAYLLAYARMFFCVRDCIGDKLLKITPASWEHHQTRSVDNLAASWSRPTVADGPNYHVSHCDSLTETVGYMHLTQYTNQSRRLTDQAIAGRRGGRQLGSIPKLQSVACVAHGFKVLLGTLSQARRPQSLSLSGR